MWLFTTHGFFSVVRESTRPMANVVIRARDDRHLDKLLTHVGQSDLTHRIIHTTDSDYPYRVIVPKHTWTAISERLSDDIDYTNFKEKVGRRNQRYSDVLHLVWAMVAAHYQRKRRMVMR